MTDKNETSDDDEPLYLLDADGLPEAILDISILGPHIDEIVRLAYDLRGFPGVMFDAIRQVLGEVDADQRAVIATFAICQVMQQPDAPGSAVQPDPDPPTTT
ncbi:hypothetical protein [Frondihabitans sp. VKM Ac-2883]|uniref:hypothetical protein n=1 Tax=Frondihabitans sp. VKM Ac-2883 TaxID=2783823 RepID=UPI00188B3D0F|nr:hypothetical protein [Frondihabitans sp. VKM Ac-2883]MBF4575051.1 hypothetical protein [Frondihabitans sp. VKM Ac-2883]